MATANGLNKIVGCDNNERLGDIIFAHGLMGHPRRTWHPQEKKDDENFWPAWLGEDFPNLGIWSLGYKVEPFAWKGSSLPLVDSATNVLAEIETHNIGSRPLFFITHSMGGLLIKQMLRHAQDIGNRRWKSIVEQTKGIVFFSTPHSGADIASWIKHIGGLIQANVCIGELEAHHPRLRELNLLYRNHERLSKIPMLVFCETEETYGFIVVNATSADPGMAGVIPIPVEYNHISICKIQSRDEMRYRQVKMFIEDNFNPKKKVDEFNDERKDKDQHSGKSQYYINAPANNTTFQGLIRSHGSIQIGNQNNN